MEYENRKKFIVNFLYISLILLIMYITIKYVFGLLAPFLLAFVVAFLLKTPARYLAKKLRLPYKMIFFLLVLLFYSTIAFAIVLVGIKAVTSTIDFAYSIPNIYNNGIEPTLNIVLNEMQKTFLKMDPSLVSSLNEVYNQIISSGKELVTNLSIDAVSVLSGFVSGIPGLFIKILLMLISTFFIAVDYDSLTKFVTRQFSNNTRTLIFKIKEYVIGTLFVCIRSYALIMTITFIELSIGLSIIKVPNAIIIALLIAIFDILPVLGTGGIMIPWMIVVAIQGNYSMAISLLIVYLIITIIRNILEPKIVGAQIGLHPIVTLVSMFVGAQLFGFIGLFGFPITISLLKYLNDTKTINIFK